MTSTEKFYQHKAGYGIPVTAKKEPKGYVLYHLGKAISPMQPYWSYCEEIKKQKIALNKFMNVNQFFIKRIY